MLLDQRVIQTETTTPTHTFYNRLNFMWLADPSFYEILEFVTPTVAGRNMWEIMTIIERLSNILGYLATGNCFEGLKFINATSQSIGDIFTAQQTDSNWMNIVQYHPDTIHILHYIITRWSKILCWILLIIQEYF